MHNNGAVNFCDSKLGSVRRVNAIEWNEVKLFWFDATCTGLLFQK